MLRNFVIPRNLGCVTASDGKLRLVRLIRMPDVAAVTIEISRASVCQTTNSSIAPYLAVAVLSVSNTASEMQRKRREYFDSGVSLVWMIDPRERSAVSSTHTPEEYTEYGASDSVTGGGVLPGFTLSLSDVCQVGSSDRNETGSPHRCPTVNPPGRMRPRVRCSSLNN